MATDLGPLLAAVTDEWERGLVIAQRAGINARTIGGRMKALEADGLVEHKYTKKYGGVRLYRRTEAAPPLGAHLVDVEHEHHRYVVSVGIRGDVEGVTAGVWSKSGPVEFGYGITVHAPDAPTLRAIINSLQQGLERIEAGL